MGRVDLKSVELRQSILLALGLAGCVTRTLPGDDSDTQGDDSNASSESTSGDSTGRDDTTNATTIDPVTAGDDGPQCTLNPEAFNEFQLCVPRLGASCGFCEDSVECRDLAKLLASEAGFCMPEFIGTQCGPEAMGEQCCSIVLMEDWGCAGRPFVVEGKPRNADACIRSDWKANLNVASASTLDSELRKRLADTWTEVALAEHASIASFSRFMLDLLAVGASVELVLAAQRATEDEITHAQLAFALASSYRGESIGPSALATGDALTGSRNLATIVKAAIIEGCVGETVSASLCQHAHDECLEPTPRRVLACLARDERRHAQLAWQFVAWALRTDASLHQVVRTTIDTALAEIDHAAPFSQEESPLAKRLRSHGILSQSEADAIRRSVAQDVIAPCAAALLEATLPIAA